MKLKLIKRVFFFRSLVAVASLNIVCGSTTSSDDDESDALATGLNWSEVENH